MKLFVDHSGRAGTRNNQNFRLIIADNTYEGHFVKSKMDVRIQIH